MLFEDRRVGRFELSPEECEGVEVPKVRENVERRREGDGVG